MNLTEWVHAEGVHVTTAYRWCQKGVLPVPTRKVGRLILVSSGTAAASSLEESAWTRACRVMASGPARAVIVVEHRDRLGRVNAELAEAALSAHGRPGGAGRERGDRRPGTGHDRVLKAVERARWGIGPQVVPGVGDAPGGGTG